MGVYMFSGYERRQLERYKIPGAQVRYKQHGGFQEAKEFTATVPLVDFTKISIRFKSQHTLQPGAFVELIIIKQGSTLTINASRFFFFIKGKIRQHIITLY